MPLKLSNYRFHTVIGKSLDGAADVYSGRHVTGEAVAIRCVSLECDGAQLDKLQVAIDSMQVPGSKAKSDADYGLIPELNWTHPAVKFEINALRNLSHVCLQSLSAAFVHGNVLSMVQPLMDYGSATDMMRAKYEFGLPENMIAHILRDVLLAVQYLHHRDIIHRAIRASHILVSSRHGVRLTGLRHCTSSIKRNRRGHVLHDMDTANTNLLWLAPEILRQDLHGYTSKSDSYSIGITACEMANGFPPFADMQHMQMLYEKLRGTTPRLLDVSTLPPDEPMHTEQRKRTFSKQFHDFTDVALRGIVQERWSATELLEHAFVKQAKKSKSNLSQLLLDIRPISVPKMDALGATLPPMFARRADAEDISQSDNWMF